MASECSRSEILKGKVTVVTRSRRGIGAATAKALAAVGVHVAVLDLMLPGLDGLEVCRKNYHWGGDDSSPRGTTRAANERMLELLDITGQQNTCHRSRSLRG
jgi:NAD(P)-dependent dehydrogenase (short-subunit alcohol dehydrogenase family)